MAPALPIRLLAWGALGTALHIGLARFGYGVVLHQLPVSLMVWWVLSDRPRGVTWFTLSLMAVTTVIGYVAEPTIIAVLPDRAGVWFEAVVGGSLLHVIAHPAHAHDDEHGHSHAPAHAHDHAHDHAHRAPDAVDAEHHEIRLDAANLPPIVTWGTSPEDVVSITGNVPLVDTGHSDQKKAAIQRALDYMGLKGGEKITDIKLDRVFIGSCTNGRIEDLRAVAKAVEGKTVASTVSAMIVPGSGLVKLQAEEEGLDKIFKAAGFDWREPGCSMCLAMNADKLAPGERCASTSNRNFEGRQGFKGRTHLVSPIMAAAAAIEGHFVDVRTWA